MCNTSDESVTIVFLIRKHESSESCQQITQSAILQCVWGSRLRTVRCNVFTAGILYLFTPSVRLVGVTHLNDTGDLESVIGAQFPATLCQKYAPWPQETGGGVLCQEYPHPYKSWLYWFSRQLPCRKKTKQSSQGKSMVLYGALLFTMVKLITYVVYICISMLSSLISMLPAFSKIISG